MRTVYKYPLHGGPGSSICIRMPKDARILSVQLQRDVPTIWALVDPGAPEEGRCFFVAFTGHHEVPERSKFLGTMQTGPIVLHAFEVNP